MSNESFFAATTIIATLISLDTNASFDLKGLIDYALKNSPSFKIASNQLKIAEINKENALSSFFPMLNLQTIQGFRDSKPEQTDDKWKSSLELSLDAKLYDNGNNIYNYDQSKLEQTKSILELKATQNKLILEITEEYFNYLLGFRLLDIQNLQYSFLFKKYNSIENQYKQGLKTRLDYLRFKSKLQKSDLTKKQALNNQSKIIERLKSLIGWREDILVVQIPVNTKIDLVKIPQIAPPLEFHFTNQIAKIEREINYFTVKRVERKYWPELYLDTGITYTNPDYIDDWNDNQNDEGTNWSALLTLKFNIWDWGIRKRNLISQRITNRNFNYTNDNLILRLKSDINILMLNLAQQTQNFILNKELEKLEKNNFNSLNNDYKNGKTSFLDLSQSLDNYVQAQQASTQNYYELKSSLAEYYFHEGTLYEKIILL